MLPRHDAAGFRFLAAERGDTTLTEQTDPVDNERVTMTTTVVDDNEAPTEEVAEATEAVADAVADTAEAVADAVAEATDDAPELTEVDLTVEHRLTVLEERMERTATREELDNLRDTAWNAQERAINAEQTAEAALSEADAATDPGEVEDMIEGTEIVENEDGEVALDAPSDVPPPGAQQHWTQVSGKELLSRISKRIGGNS